MLIKHTYLNGNKQDTVIEEPKAWYETIWGLVLLTVGLNVFSNYIYDKGREKLRYLDSRRERQRDIDFLKDYENKTQAQAEQYVDEEQDKVEEEIK